MASTVEQLQEVEALMFRHEREPEHVLQVRKMALALFAPLAAFHQLGQGECFCLEAAALLHDIGHVHAPDGRGHHKWSGRMIREHGWKTIPPREIELIACTARYHRKSPPAPEHEEFSALSAADQTIIVKLAALLRVADALDRSHLQVIRGISVRIDGRKITIQADAAGDITAERQIIPKKAELLEAILDCELVFGD